VTVSLSGVQIENQKRDKIIATAKKYIGTPYVYGGSRPGGFDCSGFTSYVYKQAVGKSIGRTTYNQINAGKIIPTAKAKKGDLLMFAGQSHVGIYVSKSKMLHAPMPGMRIGYQNLAYMRPAFAIRVI
jgi:cell wall-associated NlpC family hydrolase